MSKPGIDPTRVALGTWSGGLFMHFGEPLDDDRYEQIITPGRDIPTVITADVYGVGEADMRLGRALGKLFNASASGAGQQASTDRPAAGAGPLTRDDVCIVGAVGHDFYDGERDGAKGYPRFTDPRLRGPDQYATYLRTATEKSLERVGIDNFDLLLLHNPDRTGYTSETVWDGMQALKDAGLTRRIGIAPGPANGFTLDLLDCFERFGDRLDWAMMILGPLEPWPGEYVLDAAASNDIKIITRVVDYGGLFFEDLHPDQPMAPQDHRKFRPDGWIARGRERVEQMRPIAERAGLSMIQLACQWNLAHEAVHTVVPTLIQEAGPNAKTIESKRAELAALPAEQRLSPDDIATIRELGDNFGSMALKGAHPLHDGDERPDGWVLTARHEDVARRWQIDPARDLVKL